MTKHTATPDCRASGSVPKAFGIHRMEPRGRERHIRAAHQGERAGANESNALQLFVSIRVHSWLKLLAVASPRRVIRLPRRSLGGGGWLKP
jgi:hypothetical protein